MATLQLFTLGGSEGMLLQEILGVLRRILVHSEAYREAYSSLLAELLEYWKPSPSARVCSIDLLLCLYHSIGMHAQANACMPEACTQS